MKYKIDVNIVDDHIMLTEGLAEAINQSEIAHVSHTFPTIESCRLTLTKRVPDILLLDISMPDGNGIEFCKQVLAQYSSIKIIAITCHNEYSIIKNTIDNGAHGYLLKNTSVSELLEAISTVYHGKQYVSDEVSLILKKGETEHIFLTEVEKNVLRLICKGYTNPQIAEHICLSTETINWYRKRLLAKFNVKNTVNLVTLVLRDHLL